MGFDLRWSFGGKRADKANTGVPDQRSSRIGSFVPQKQWVDSRSITLDQLDELFDRNGLARKMVNVIADKTFNKWFKVISADETVQRQVELLDKDKQIRFRATHKEAYRLKLRHGYGLVFYGYEDGGAGLDQPVTSPLVIKQLKVYSRRAVKEWIYEFPNNQGNVTHVVLKGSELGQVADVRIHMSRIQVIGDACNGKSILHVAYNWLNVFDNNVWSMGQSYYRYASGFPFLKIEGATDEEFEKAEAMWRTVTARTGFVGDERYDLEFKGAEGSALPVKDYYDCGLRAAAIAADIPYSILEGQQAGAVTGSETNSSELYDKIESIQRTEVEPDLFDSYGLFVVTGQVDSVDFEIEWNPLWPMDEKEEAEIFAKKVEAWKGLCADGHASTNELRRALDIKVLDKDVEYDIPGGDVYKKTVPPSPFGAPSADPEVPVPRIPPGSEGAPSSSTPKAEDSVARPLSDELSKLEDDPEIEKAIAAGVSEFAKLYDWSQMKKAISALTTVDAMDDNPDEFLNKVDLIVDKNEADMRFTVDKVSKRAFDLGVARAVAETQFEGEVSDATLALLSNFKGMLFQTVKGLNADVKKALRNRLLDELAKTGGSNLRSVRNALLEELDVLREAVPGYRLQTIARTETNRAFNSANYSVYKDAGVGKIRWLQASDDVDDLCNLQGETVKIGQLFSNGYARPPVHPNCRCSIVPVVG